MDNYSIHTIVPQLRFPEFANDGDWEEAKVGDVIKTITPPKKLNSSEYKKKREVSNNRSITKFYMWLFR